MRRILEGGNAATLTCMRPRPTLKPGERMTACEADSDVEDGDGKDEKLLIPDELWLNNTDELSYELMLVFSSEGGTQEIGEVSEKSADRGRSHSIELMLPNDPAATRVNDVGCARPRGEERKEQGATSGEHGLNSTAWGCGIHGATEAVDVDDATDAAGPDDATEAARADDTADAVSAHDAMLAGDPSEPTASVGARDVPVTVGDARDDVTQVIIRLETKTVPTRLPADGGRGDATIGRARGHGKGRNQGEVKVTHDTDGIHGVLDVNADKVSQDEA